MKKFIIVLISIIMAFSTLSLFTGCNECAPPDDAPTTTTPGLED